jgi:hypothetical protein
MFNVIRPILLSSAVVSLGSLILATKVNAQTQPVCTFSNVTTGQLAGNPQVQPTQLISLTALGGHFATVNVTCSAKAKLTISTPIQTSGTNFTPVSSLVTVRTSLGGLMKTGDPPLNLPKGTTVLKIDLQVDKGSLVTPGNYGYNFKLTILP